MAQAITPGAPINPDELERIYDSFATASAGLAEGLGAKPDDPAMRRLTLAVNMAFDVARRSVNYASKALDELRAVHRIARIGNWRVIVEGRFTTWSDDMHELFGTDPEHFIPSFDNLLNCFTPADRNAFFRAFIAVIETQRNVAIEVRARGPDDTHRWFWTDMQPEFDAEGTLYAVRGICQEITERKVALERISYMSTHDPLTSLINRSYLLERLAPLLEEAQRRRENVAILSFDVDDFESINSLVGHNEADLLLCEIAARIKQHVRETDLVARIGGDEFAVVQVTGAQPDAAEALARRIMREINRPAVLPNGRQITLSASAGIAIHPFDGQTPGALLGHSSQALHLIKANRSSSLAFYDASIQAEWQKRRLLEQDLRLALQNDELSLVYQPMFCMRSAHCHGFEALLRWNSPIHGPVPPDLFISIAESIGLMEELGAWVLREACHEAANWSAPLTIAVNVSPQQIQHGDLVAVVSNALDSSGLPPERLEIEVTESLMIGNLERAVITLRNVKALGVRISIDDFGTGYSSLATLRAFPFDKLKIDRSFICDLSAASESLTIVNAVLGLGRGLRLPVVAEGVETQQQADLLRACGADIIQGFLISRPLPICAFSDITNPESLKARRLNSV